MKKLFLELIGFILAAVVIVFLNFSAFQHPIRIGDFDTSGYLWLTGVGSGLGLINLIYITLVLVIDFAWVLVFIGWILKKRYKILRKEDNKIYLP